MKKLMLLIAAFVFVYQASQAQTEKGTQTIGANLGFGYSKNDQLYISTYDQSTSNQNGKTTYFNIGPSYSYFIANNLDLGASLQYQSYVTNYNPDTYSSLSKQINRNYGGSIYLRKYFMYANKIGLRAGPYLDYEKQITKYDYSGSNATDSFNGNDDNFSAGVNLDLVYYPSKHLGMSASIANVSYQHTKINNANQGNGSIDNVNFDFINNGLTFSVFYVFGGK
ncbi:hypothetical protein [Mucilaginibacter sp.]